MYWHTSLAGRECRGEWIFVSLTRGGLMGQAIRYLIFGEGETGLMVYAILLRYWEWTSEEDIGPLIFLMSDETRARVS